MKVLMLLVLVISVSGVATVAQAGTKKQLVQAAMARMLARDAARDGATSTTHLLKCRTVYRYVQASQSRRELAGGFSANSHFTSRVAPGRPLSAATAQRRYGLPQPPQSRTTVHLPRGTEVRFNKVIGGQPGYGEITVAKPLSRQAIITRDSIQ